MNFSDSVRGPLAGPEPIVEIGAFQVSGQEAIADLRPIFPGKRYIGCDMQPGPGVDRIEDIHALSFASGEVGTFTSRFMVISRRPIGTNPPPDQPLPNDFAEKTSAKYREAFRGLTNLDLH